MGNEERGRRREGKEEQGDQEEWKRRKKWFQNTWISRLWSVHMMEQEKSMELQACFQLPLSPVIFHPLPASSQLNPIHEARSIWFLTWLHLHTFLRGQYRCHQLRENFCHFQSFFSPFTITRLTMGVGIISSPSFFLFSSPLFPFILYPPCSLSPSLTSSFASRMSSPVKKCQESLLIFCVVTEKSRAKQADKAWQSLALIWLLRTYE